MKNNIGFTLAEVLITLGIIGIVAALTIPGIIQKQQEKTVIVRLKKAYSALSQAYLFAAQEYGTPDEWDLKKKEAIYDEDGNISGYDTSGIEIQRKYLTKFMKGRNCETVKKCIAGDKLKITNLSQITSQTNDIVKFPKFMLADGTIIQFSNVLSETCSLTDIVKANVCSHIEVFLPTGEREYRRGVNNFMFYLTKDGIIPAGRQNANLYTFGRHCVNNKSVSDEQNGHGCTAWVVAFENMDYLHCSDLSWSGKHKCK